jgi:hypothetical protein
LSTSSRELNALADLLGLNRPVEAI